MDNYDKFIGKLYDILLSSDIISYDDKARDLKEKKERLEKYLNKLDRVQSKAISKEEHIKTLKRLYYDKYIIKRENIPDSYFKSLEKRYLDEGHGHHNLVNPDNEIDRDLKEQHINVIIREQKDSLDSWLNYFLSKDSDYLPMWAKVWAFQGMLGIGNLNKEKDGYGRRSNTAVNPFVSLDSEILGKCVELVKETFDNKDVNDKEIDKLVASGSFSKLYGKLLANKKQLKIDSNEGIWIKYNYETKEQADKKIKEGKEPEYLKLYNSLQGYNTGWCTAGSKETAKSQICGSDSYLGGDFYVYYTKDKSEEYKVPRIAIRMNKNSIGEIRGIASGQNIESNMDSVLEEKLKEFPDGKLYQKRVHDMKLLTEIYDNYEKRELTKEELRFLYEIDDEISNFGYQEDPRIAEIKEHRNKRTDLSIIFNCSSTQIGFTEAELYKNQLVYYGDSINTEMYLKMQQLKFDPPDYVDETLSLRTLTSTKGLKLPKRIVGDLYLDKVSTAKGLILPKRIDGYVFLYRLTTAEGVTLPESVGRGLDLQNLITTKGLILPKSVGGYIDLSSLVSAKGLKLPEKIGGNLDLSSLKTVEGLEIPENIGGLYLSSLTTAEGLKLPKNINGSVYLDNLVTAKGVTFPENISGCLNLRSLTTAEGLILPKNVEEYIELSSLVSAKGLALPQNIGGSIYLEGLVTAKGLKLPEDIKEGLDLRNLTTAEGLILPKRIGGRLNLKKLITAEGLILPQSIGGSICLDNLKTLKGITLPESVKGTIVYQGINYTLDEIKELQKLETRDLTIMNNNKKLIKINRKGFTTGIYTITLVLIITIISIVIALLIINIH